MVETGVARNARWALKRSQWFSPPSWCGCQRWLEPEQCLGARAQICNERPICFTSAAGLLWSRYANARHQYRVCLDVGAACGRHPHAASHELDLTTICRGIYRRARRRCRFRAGSKSQSYGRWLGLSAWCAAEPSLCWPSSPSRRSIDNLCRRIVGMGNGTTRRSSRAQGGRG